MSQEIVGEVTVRSSQPVLAVASETSDSASAGDASEGIAADTALAAVASFLPPNLLAGPVTIRMSGDGKELMIGSGATAATARIHLDGATGNITVRDFAGTDVLRFNSRFALMDIGGTGNEGDIRVRNNADTVTIHLDGNSGDIRLSNADAAEDFDVSSLEAAEPGTVMVLVDDGPLHPSSVRRDPRVVGVVAGAGGYRPGIILDSRSGGSIARVPISIMGKVSVKAVAEDGPIAVGHLLTTSSERGRAMSASDLSPPMGAVIGKALSPLSRGTGMVDMLVGLR